MTLAPPAAQDLFARLAGTRRPVLVILLVWALFVVPGFLSIPPSDRDESRFAQATKQMLEMEDFVAIRFGDVARNKKPVGIHWAQAASVTAAEAMGLAGRTDIWPYRVPSALGGLIAALATFWLGRALIGREAALVAAVLLLAALVVTVEMHIAKTDAALLGTIAVMMGLFGRAVVAPERFGPSAAAGFWFALGVGTLLKGPVAPMVAGLAALALWMSDRLVRRPSSWLGALRAAWGLPLAFAVVLPWGVAIWLATDGAFFLEAIRGDLGQKVVGADEQHGGPPGYHLLLAAITLFPGSLAVLRAIPAVWAGRDEPATRFLLAWILPTWLVFELLPTKLPHYVAVTFPAVLLLAARWLLDPSGRPPPRWLARLSLGLWLIAPLGLAALAIALPLVAGGMPWGLPLALAAAGWILWQGVRVPDTRRAVASGLIGSVVLYGAILQGVIPEARGIWLSPRIAEAAEAHWAATGGRPPASDRPFAAVGFHEPSLVFLVGTDVRLLRGGEEAAWHLAERGRGLALVRDRNEAAFRAEADRLRLAVREVARIDGFNLSRGQFVSLGLYAR